MLYKESSKDIKFYDDFFSMVSEAKIKEKQDGTKQKAGGLKTLTPKQMLQKLPIALEQLKAGTNSECLLNEIRQNVYYLHQSKEITKSIQ